MDRIMCTPVMQDTDYQEQVKVLLNDTSIVRSAGVKIEASMQFEKR